jgi:rhamnulose-1-phosphate aldolase/alcohol dehydrogenase
MDGQPAEARAVSRSSHWDTALAAGLSAQERLLYRSHLLGADKHITNFGGGNTSSKIASRDPLTGEPTTVLWVKGSGGDLRTMELDGFATLYLDRLLGLATLYRGRDHEDELVPLYAQCAFAGNPRAPSIDTPLHALVDRPCIDHVHPDAVIALASAKGGEALTEEIFRGEIGWIGWLRPGFELGLRLAEFSRANPGAKGVVLQSHGLFTWGETDQACYENTVDIVARTARGLAERHGSRPAFGCAVAPPLEPSTRREIAAAVMPALRGMVSERAAKVGHFDDQQAVLEFVGGEALKHLATLGASCPDHFLRTKIWPMVVDFDSVGGAADGLIAATARALDAYRADYGAYYERCRRPSSPPMRDASPVVSLVPGLGMITFAADKPSARIAAEFFVNSINVMREANAVSTYQALTEQEAFDIEYWALEEAKLKRLPKPGAFAGRVAVISGGAGGIGAATARRLLADGACVVVCDIDKAALEETRGQLTSEFGEDNLRAEWTDVTDESAVAQVFAQTCLHYGGVDICVSNAGLASAAAIEDTSLDLWRRNFDVLSTGYFLFARESVRLFKAQRLGGSLIFIGSKNALAASPGASAYGAAKASELHLARSLAVECAPSGIRVNVVNPDAVLQGSRIWQGEWRSARAHHHNAEPHELEEIYRERSLLKRSVYPEDVAEAVAWFASDLSAKTTGAILNVDAGHAAAFTR